MSKKPCVWAIPNDVMVVQVLEISKRYKVAIHMHGVLGSIYEQTCPRYALKCSNSVNGKFQALIKTLSWKRR